MFKGNRIILILFLAGLIILVIPDKDPPVIKLNKLHGPSVPDMAGVVLLFTGWLASCIRIFKQWRHIVKRLGNHVYALVGIFFISHAGIIMALSLSFDWLLWSCVLTASAVNILLFVFSHKPQR